MFPLQIAYVTDGNGSSAGHRKGGMFAFGSGTLQGHLLVHSHATVDNKYSSSLRMQFAYSVAWHRKLIFLLEFVEISPGVRFVGAQAGEERFSVQLDEDDQVWYEVLSFSKPAHILSTLCYPYVQLRQRHFAQQSGQALLRHVAASCSRN